MSHGENCYKNQYQQRDRMAILINITIWSTFSNSHRGLVSDYIFDILYSTRIYAEVEKYEFY